MGALSSNHSRNVSRTTCQVATATLRSSVMADSLRGSNMIPRHQIHELHAMVAAAAEAQAVVHDLQARTHQALVDGPERKGDGPGRGPAAPGGVVGVDEAGRRGRERARAL